MKIYFEDGPLTATQSLKLGCDYIVNAATGYSDNEQTFKRIKDEEPNASVYTNALGAISNYYCWNDELKVPELYLRSSKTGEFVRVDSLTDRAIRMPNHLLNLYFSGAFKD